MSDDTALAAFVASAAVLATIWWLAQRDEARSRERYEAMRAASGTASVLKPATGPAGSADIVAALERVLEELKTAKHLLDEVYSIGLWSKSDDSSDNRRKRQGMRETDWAVSGAHRALTALRPRLQEVPEPLHALERDLGSLVAVIEPLPETIIDTMGENFALDSAINNISEEVTRLSARASQLAAEYRQRIAQESVKPPELAPGT